ncbi:MAG: RNA polymerase sigma factor [Arenimonas sp.]
MTDATETSLRLQSEVFPSAAEAALPLDLDGFLAGVERRAFRLAELTLGHREDALDAVQDAMIQLLRYRSRPAAEWRPLFWSILRRQLTDRHRRNAVKRRVLVFLGRGESDRENPLEMLPDPQQDPSRQLLASKSWRALGAAVRRLPTRQRECFLLRELQGLSVAETAAAMGCSDGSVKTHLSRAMDALRIHLEDWR